MPYTEFGAMLATIMIIIVAMTIIQRLVMSFRNYIYTGNAGNFEHCWFIQVIDNKGPFSEYAFTGVHPGGVVIDAFMLSFVSFAMVGAWAPIVIVLLIYALAKQMRKRIAHKQEFVGNLNGDQLGE